MHKLNVNLPRQKVKQMFKEADTDDNQGTLGFDEFCAFYKMMSTRRDLYLLMITYSNHKDHLDADDLKRFLEVEQKMMNVTKEYCLDIVDKFEPCPENKKDGVLGIDGFTNYMRSPAGDIFNPVHYQVNQEMTLPLSNYFIASSHNTYLMGDQLMSQSRVDMYAWVLQAGCRCVEVDCWDGPDGEPIVHHGYTLTSKILFKDVIETINKYAFIRNDYPVILSIENHCSVLQQKKMAQYLTEILGDQLDLSTVFNGDSTKLPSPETLKGKILVKGKKLPASISDDAEEGEVSDEDSADEIDDDCKLINGDASTNRKQVENIAKKRLDSMMKESKIRDCEDPNNFTVTTLTPTGKLGQKAELKKKCNSGPAVERSTSKTEEETESGEEPSPNKRHSRSLMGSFSKRKKKGGRIKKSSSLEEGEDSLDRQGSIARTSVHYSRINRQKKTMKLSRALSDLVKYTKSVGIHDVETEISSSWQVSSFSETKAHQILQQKPAQFVRFNQYQLSRIYPSSYRVDSSNYNPQPFWNAGCQLVALNYQSEGRMLQLNRAKFNSNGSCGYVLKPKCMCHGAFNPNSDDPLPGQLKKQLVLRIISGQQLPKPKDSMLGDRGEIIDPFVEVELIGLPVDCYKEQTRVVDDNGFNPMWEETLVFNVHMPEVSLIRFLVWDHDPIGRDFIGQRTISLSSMMPGYRHVYLEGMEEASVFVHVAINDISGKVKQAVGLKGLFLRNPKQASLDSHAAGQLHRKHSISSHILRRTASAPTKGQQKNKKGFPEIAIDSKDNSSEGASEDKETDDSSIPRFDKEPESASPIPPSRDGTPTELHSKSLKDARPISICRSVSSLCSLETITEEFTFAKQIPLPGPTFHQPVASITNEDSKGHKELTGSQSESSSISDNMYRPLRINDLAIGKINLLNNGPITTTENSEKIYKNANAHNANGKQETTITINSFNMKPGLSLLADVSRENKVRQSKGSQGEWFFVQRSNSSEASTKSSEQQKNLTPVIKDLPPCILRPKPDQFLQQSSMIRTGPPVPVRRTKSEGHVLSSSSAFNSTLQSPVAEVYSDATINDRIWSKLELNSHRDSMSSSSSKSSNDTVIDLSLPNLAQKNLLDLDISDNFDSINLQNSIRPRSATTLARGGTSFGVTKSKSNPNLISSTKAIDGRCPRPLARSPEEVLPPLPRRNTWNRLYVDSLKQTARKPSTNKATATQSMSKSLGDLTSDDISCNFESKYRSISRSFITRSMRAQRRPAGMNASTKSTDSLTEQLKQLTSFEKENDITSPTEFQPVQYEDDGMNHLRRTSSRSQSRVRYVANRAKQAQERQRLQNLVNGNSIEERGNPEGACAITKGFCMDSLLTTQFTSESLDKFGPQ
ncbi:1-phosphatidylinositol 4,5-bisphosphate phosphodiesterase eta-2-like [Rhinoderma darwinii]|uniref:1-phosphatidylinositol 4,5-bisphosphate phosphodiesterase eta-2-like n=1 Tax=Rhinoderma darwinii TaxID=43563 RepID=UPI003F674021